MDDATKLEFHMLDHCANDELRDELRDYFRRYPFTVVAGLVDSDGNACNGLAYLETGAIELNRSLLNETSEQALHVYLHELAHVVANDAHTLDFAALAAGLQQHFHCRDVSRWRLNYDLHESDDNDWRTSEYAHLRRGGSVRAIAEPEVWIERRRASQEALAVERWREQNLWPNVAALVVAVVALAGIVAWPWVSELLSDRILMFSVGFVFALGVIASALLSVNNT